LPSLRFREKKGAFFSTTRSVIIEHIVMTLVVMLEAIMLVLYMHRYIRLLQT